jgi:hypothetical protein
MRQYEAICRGTSAMPNCSRLLSAGIVCFIAAAGAVRAGEIYKSIDPDGRVVYSDHLDPSMSQSTVVHLEDPRFPPGQLHFCWTNCFTLILDKGVYRRTDGTDESWTVETFSANAVVLHRHDAPSSWNGNSQDVVYAGRVSNDRLTDVTVNGKPMSGIDASWGAALTTLPGSNAERDAKNTADPNSSSGTVSSVVTPPPLPEEPQPTLSQDGYLWTPGYWYWRNQRYFWMSGAWVRPPQLGALWTPAYWASAGAVFVFHPGHWGSTVGFYGGVNYGYGYFGNGYTGGHWVGNSFAYNSAVNRVDPAIAHHTYAESVPNQVSRSVVGYNSGLRSGDASRTASQLRTSETTPMQKNVDRPAAVAQTSAPNAVPKTSRVTPRRVEPVK